MQVLYLDAATRAFRAVGPPSAPIFDEELTAGAITVDVEDEQWQQVLHPAWVEAHRAGLDLIVHEDGSTSRAVHVAAVGERLDIAHKAALRAFAGNPAPTAEMRDAAIRALIHHLELD